MENKKILKLLVESNGVSGFESEIKETVKELISPLCDEVYENRFNSVIGIKKSKYKNAKKMVIEAHLDQIGLIVSGIDEKGYLKFMSIGGVYKRILPGSEVYILGKEKVFGIIGAIPPHLKGGKDEEKMPEISGLLIDTGYSKDEISKKVSVGDSIIFKSSLTELMGNTVSAPALDNRAGITAVIAAAEQIDNSPYDIYFVFSSEEEIGLHGAYSAASEIKPDIAVVVDVTHGMTVDSKDDSGVFRTGSGAIICKGPTLNKELTEKIIFTAKKRNIKYDIEVASGHTGTNAWAIHKNAGECKIALISIPLKYMHTSVEVLDISDIDEVSRLLSFVAEGGIENA